MRSNILAGLAIVASLSASPVLAAEANTAGAAVEQGANQASGPRGCASGKVLIKGRCKAPKNVNGANGINWMVPALSGVAAAGAVAAVASNASS